MNTHSTAVLVSGGIDSTVLLADEAAAFRAAIPIHIRVGFAWEAAEARMLDRLLAAAPLVGTTQPLVTLNVDAGTTYPADHWARVGTPPPYDSPDKDVYLPDRNRLLVSRAALWCRQAEVHRLVLAPLKGNPFPDATQEFFAALATTLSLDLGHPLEVVAPYLTLTKADVIARGRMRGVPLELTMSCMNPSEDDSHCGRCSKCRERDEGMMGWRG